MFARRFAVCVVWVGTVLAATLAEADEADVILHGGKVVTVDKTFSIAEAVAIKGGAILNVGSDEQVLKTKGDKTRLVDLAGRMVLPGLIDSHVHATGAAMTEFDHPLPDMESIQDVLDYIAARAKVLDEGQWINLSQVFITRLRERRYPTKAELDRAAPMHPVVFSTGPDASVNSLALKLSGIDKDFQVVGSGHVEKDPRTGEPTGILRSCTRYIKSRSSGGSSTEKDRRDRLARLIRDYNSVGITAVADRSAGSSAFGRYRALESDGRLTVRVACSRSFSASGSIESIRKRLAELAAEKQATRGRLVRTVGVKIFLDGGMLTGSAYMRQPWGVSKIYSITDPRYRGVLFVPKEKLLPVVQAAVDAGLQFTAHSVGDGAVHTLLEVYDEVNKRTPIRDTRPCITHSNFMSREAVEMMARLGVVADVQPAWLYLDTGTLTAQFGYDRLRYFQPLASIFKAGAIAGGGSDHMQKIGSLRAINPYNPFLGMWTTVTRRARWYEGQLHPEEALTRQQTIRFYTANNAYILFREDEIGSLEAGKRADLIVVDRDLLTCKVDDLRDTRVLATYFNGRLVHERKAGR